MARQCENCDIKMPAFRPRKKGPDGRLLCDGCHPDGKGGEGRPVGHHGSIYENAQVIDRWPGDSYTGTSLLSGLRVKAHDSGDGETIYHCPFCGGGQVVGRSDGTVECDFCQTAFTVQVQPQMNGQPQTGPDGQPLEMPGMPGDPTSREAPPAPEDDEFAVIDPEQTSPVAGTAPSAGGPQGPAVDVNAEFAVLSTKFRPRFFLTGEGVLNEEAYIRHLAIKYADDRDAVLADIRKGRR